MNNLLRLWVFLLVGLAVVLWSCKDDDFSTSEAIQLSFSSDTLRLDTVFTERGSATYILKAYNESDDHVMIESIKLLDDTGFFRLNIDGIPGNESKDVPIYANDSIYIFCEVTIDPDQPLSVSPFIIQDRIEFVTNGNAQIVHLEAWGQNANYFPSRSNQQNIARLTCANSEIVWDDEKPYVLYGVLLVDSCTLRILAGRQIYVHGGIVNNDIGLYNDGILFIQANGRLLLEGTLDAPIIIQDDRLEPAFDDAPGQWSALRFGPGSTGNRITHTIIKNSIVGVQMDSLSEADLSHVEIYNTAGSGVVAVHANLEMQNCLVHNNGGNSLAILHGGFARISYCTFANYGNENESIRMSNFRCYDPLCESFSVNGLNAAIVNSMVIGDDTDEIALLDGTNDGPEDFTFVFDHCLYRANRLPDDDPTFLENCTNCLELDRNAPLFVDRLEGDYHLDTLSQVEGLARPIPTIILDKDEIPRDASTPDIGCFEYNGY